MADATGTVRAPTVGRAQRSFIRAPADFAAGTALVLLAAFALWASADLDVGTLRSAGPGLVPRAIAILVGAIGLGVTVSALVNHGPAVERWKLRGPVFVTLGILAFALTIRLVGLVVAGPLVMIVGGAASNETRFKELVVFAIVVTLFCVGLFRYALGLPMPILVLPGLVRI